MCKIFAMSNTSKLTRKNFINLLRIVHPIITHSEVDGFGWAVLGESGIYGEKYINPTEFDFRIFNNVKENKILKELIKEEASSFGQASKPIGPLLIHGRTSTNDKTLTNTHPFIKNNWTLIHNGVVDNLGETYIMDSTCDSEHLIHYLSSGGIESIEKYVSGYYAVAAIDPNGNLHVFKDDIASLYVAYIKTIDSFIFSTTKDMISITCKKMKWEYTEINPMKGNFYMVINKENELLYSRKIKPLKVYYDSTRQKASIAFKGSVDTILSESINETHHLSRLSLRDFEDTAYYTTDNFNKNKT